MNNDYKQKVLDTIHAKKVSMRPKLYFVAKIVLVIVLSVLLFVTLMLMASFVFFSIHESGEQFLLGFGENGIITFLHLFPWGMVVLGAVLALVLKSALGYFKFGYRLSTVRIFVYILVTTILLGILFTLTPIHSNLLKKAEVGQLPVIGHAYETIHDSHKDNGVIRGTIITLDAHTIIIAHDDDDKDFDDGVWTVIPPSGFDTTTLYIGEKIYVAGTVTNNSVSAYGIHELPTNK